MIFLFSDCFILNSSKCYSGILQFHDFQNFFIVNWVLRFFSWFFKSSSKCRNFTICNLKRDSKHVLSAWPWDSLKDFQRLSRDFLRLSKLFMNSMKFYEQDKYFMEKMKYLSNVLRKSPTIFKLVGPCEILSRSKIRCMIFVQFFPSKKKNIFSTFFRQKNSVVSPKKSKFNFWTEKYI